MVRTAQLLFVAVQQCTQRRDEGCSARFTPEIDGGYLEYLWLDTSLRKALENDQLVVLSAKITWRGEVRSLEALVRWQSPERGLIPPLVHFLRAEESGLIVPLGVG